MIIIIMMFMVMIIVIFMGLMVALMMFVVFVVFISLMVNVFLLMSYNFRVSVDLHFGVSAMSVEHLDALLDIFSVDDSFTNSLRNFSGIFVFFWMTLFFFFCLHNEVLSSS